MKSIVTSGKRKRAIARATVKEGKGVVRVNGKILDNYSSKMARLKIMEPLILAESAAKKLNISVSVHGGGVISQADAARLAVARGLIKYDESTEEVLQDYDRRLVVADVRRKEASKPNRHGKARAKRQKSYR